MKRLKAVMRKNGIDYQMVAESKEAFIYKLLPQSAGFDVFKKKVSQAGERIINGATVVYEESERWPNDKAFGAWAWHYMDLKSAMRKFESFGDLTANV